MAASNDKALRAALVLVGLIFVFGIYPLMQVWPAGWRWTPNQPEYEQMILGIYATLGVFLLLASRNPRRHLSLIWFTVWSSVVHGAVMAWHSFQHVEERGHLWGDVAALFVVAILLGALTPRGAGAREA
ncbi:MAG TPA: DUF6632 domain-containing protein [Terriglobales bacterium]|nr:DUF6632 domain-containing protein [Terriglobales bacterium]